MTGAFLSAARSPHRCLFLQVGSAAEAFATTEGAQLTHQYKYVKAKWLELTAAKHKQTSSVGLKLRRRRQGNGNSISHGHSPGTRIGDIERTTSDITM